MGKVKRTYFVCPDCNHRWSVDSRAYRFARFRYGVLRGPAVAISKSSFAFCKKCGSQGDVEKNKK